MDFPVDMSSFLSRIRFSTVVLKRFFFPSGTSYVRMMLASSSVSPASFLSCSLNTERGTFTFPETKASAISEPLAPSCLAAPIFSASFIPYADFLSSPAFLRMSSFMCAYSFSVFTQASPERTSPSRFLYSPITFSSAGLLSFASSPFLSRITFSGFLPVRPPHTEVMVLMPMSVIASFMSLTVSVASVVSDPYTSPSETR